MQRTGIQSKKAKYGYLIIAIFYIYLFVMYPFVYKYYPHDLTASFNNRFLLALLILIMLIAFGYRLFPLRLSNIDTLNIFAMCFMLYSLFIYSMLSNMNIGDIFREILFSILPIVFYFLAKTFKENEITVFYRIYLISMILIVSLGVLNLLGVQLPFDLNSMIINRKKANFTSYYSAITLGYLTQLLFALVLFKIIKVGRLRIVLLIFFFIIAILTLQKSSYLGLSCALLFYFIFHIKKNFYSFCGIVLTIFAVFYLFINLDMSETFGFDQRVFILNEIKDMQIGKVISDRSSQAIIYNHSNSFNILFGEGYGKYSPNNFQTIHKMPDTCYYRIYNELGIIGGIIFFAPFLAIFLKSLSKKDSFMLYFILFTLFAFYFNRILWAVPSSYVIYTIIGISQGMVYRRV